MTDQTYLSTNDLYNKSLVFIDFKINIYSFYSIFYIFYAFYFMSLEEILEGYFADQCAEKIPFTLTVEWGGGATVSVCRHWERGSPSTRA